MRIAVGSDDRAPLVDQLTAWLGEHGHEVVREGDGALWPEVGRRVGEAVAHGRADRGVVCCWTGTGVAIAANKVGDVRAALCADAETARGARRWNDANVLALSLRLTSAALGVEILEAFLDTAPDPAEQATIAQVQP